MAKKIDDIEEKKILESFRKAAENDRRVYNNLSLDLKFKRVESEVEKNAYNLIWGSYDYYHVTYDYEDICKIALGFKNKGNDISRTLLDFLPKFNELSETNRRKIIERQDLILKADLKDFEQIRRFITKNTPVYLVARDASEMQLQQIEKLESEGINLQYVGLEPEG